MPPTSTKSNRRKRKILKTRFYALSPERMRAAVERSGMTQQEISLRLGLGRTAVTNWLNGWSRPTPESLLAFCSVVGVRHPRELCVRVKRLSVLSLRTRHHMVYDVNAPRNGAGTEPHLIRRPRARC